MFIKPSRKDVTTALHNSHEKELVWEWLIAGVWYVRAEPWIWNIVPIFSDGSLKFNGNIGILFSNEILEKYCETFLFGSITFWQ